MDKNWNASTRFGSPSVSLTQHWMLHLARLKPAAPIHTTAVLELIGKLSRPSLRGALDQMVYRHGVLRTVFRQLAGGSVPLLGRLTGVFPSWIRMLAPSKKHFACCGRRRASRSTCRAGL